MSDNTSNSTATPTGGVAYDNTADPVWARKALDLYQDHRLQVVAFDTDGVISAQIWGPCPRCEHDLNVQPTLNTPIPGLRQGHGLWASLTRRTPRDGAGIPPTVEVGCGCGRTHRDAPRTSWAAESASAYPPPHPIRRPRPPTRPRPRDRPRHPPTTSPDTPDPDAPHTPGTSGPGWVVASSSVRPRPVSAADQQAFEALLNDALPAVRSMVVAWRTGLTGLITLVTTGVVLTGRKTTTDLTVPWRIAVTLTIGAGLGLAIVGLWHALAAEVGARTRLQSLHDIRARYASVQAYQVGLAAAAGHRLHTARTLTATALTLLLTGVLLTWWAPPAPTNPPAHLRVTHPGGTVCGALASADGGILRLRVANTHDPLTIPLSTVTNLALTPTCP